MTYQLSKASLSSESLMVITKTLKSIIFRKRYFC